MDQVQGHPKKRGWIVLAVVGTVLAGGIAAAVALRPGAAASAPARAAGFARKLRPHFDHTPVIPDAFDSPQAVTRACLGCHPDAAQVMKTSHWRWVGAEVQVAGHEGKVRIGKANLLNNFCIAAKGNEKSCTKCHIGYGWKDASFDFEKAENVDCLVCHERTGAYTKGAYGLPTKETNLAAAARSVSTRIHALSTRRRSIAACVITPVRPSPPTVAQNSSTVCGSCPVGESRRTVPVPSTRSSQRMCRPIAPSTWWFLPWTSAAIAPPTVTNLVPGLTGMNQPRGRVTRSSASSETPPPTIATPRSSSRSMPANAVQSRTHPPAFCAASP